MKRAILAIAFALTFALILVGPSSAEDDGPPPCPEFDLKSLVDKALLAAVASSGKATIALDDADVTSEGGTKVEHVIAALRAATGKHRFVKHADDVTAPMLHVRFSTLYVATSKESSIDYGLFLELEAANRAVLHANVTNLHKSGPGAKTQGHHTALTLDALADHFAYEKWAKEPRPETISVSGKATSNSIAQQCLVERIVVRLLQAKSTVVATTTRSKDVERPKGMKLLGAQIGLIVFVENVADVTLIEGSDLARGGTVYHYRWPNQGTGGLAIRHMKNLARGIEFQFRNDNYRIKPAGAKGKAWVLEAKVDAASEKIKSDLTAAVRSELVGREMPHWLFDSKDGEVTLADAKAAGIDILITPIVKPGKGNKKIIGIECRSVADDQVFDNPETSMKAEN